MFTWAVIAPGNAILRLERASLDVLKTRKHERWVRVQDGLKWRKGMTYNPNTQEAE